MGLGEAATTRAGTQGHTAPSGGRGWKRLCWGAGHSTPAALTRACPAQASSIRPRPTDENRRRGWGGEWRHPGSPRDEAVLARGWEAPHWPQLLLSPWRLLARLLAGPSPPSAGLLPPSALLRRTPSATPKPQGQHARPPAFLPCFHLGGVPRNTRLPEAAAASGPWERTWKPWLGRGLQHHQPSRWPRDESREPRRQGWAGPTSAASGVWRRGGGRGREGDLRNVAGGADTRVFLCAWLPASGGRGQAQEPEQGTWLERRPGAARNRRACLRARGLPPITAGSWGAPGGGAAPSPWAHRLSPPSPSSPGKGRCSSGTPRPEPPARALRTPPVQGPVAPPPEAEAGLPRVIVIRFQKHSPVGGIGPRGGGWLGIVTRDTRSLEQEGGGSRASAGRGLRCPPGSPQPAPRLAPGLLGSSGGTGTGPALGGLPNPWPSTSSTVPPRAS